MLIFSTVARIKTTVAPVKMERVSDGWAVV
jgi:hypothetical protein